VGGLRRVKISVSVDPKLLEVVDAYVEAHPALDRGRVFDEALALWYHALLAEAHTVPDEDLDGPSEPRDWRSAVDPALLAKAEAKH
jgi:hypothetical protein